MKRKSLLLDEQKVDEARKLLGTKTDAAAVNRAVDEAIRIIKIRSITEFFGKGLWESDLSEMRADRPRRVLRRRKKAS